MTNVIVKGKYKAGTAACGCIVGSITSSGTTNLINA